MKKPIVIIAALALSFCAKAQSLEDGIKMVKYERYTKAKEILTPMATGNAAANYYLGLAELGLENTDAAGADFAKFPNDPANMAGMARVAFTKKNTTDGMRLAAAAAGMAKKKDWEPLKYAADAITYTDGGDIQQAISWYKAALGKHDDADLHIALGDAYRKAGNGGDAMSQWEGVTGKDPKNSLAWSRIGSLWYGARQYDRALEAYQKAKDTDPDNPIPYRDLADAYYASGKFELALQNNEDYLKRSDKSCDDQITHANLIYLTKNYKGAIAEMQSVLSTCGEKAYMYRIIGYSEYEIGNYPEALRNMRLFFAKQTNPAKILNSDYFYLARISVQSHQWDSADYYYQLAVSKDTSKNKTEVYRSVAEDYKTIKSDTAYARAGTWYKRAAKADSTAGAIDYYNWGLYAYYGRTYDEAAKAFEQMETKFPDQPSAPYWRGRVAAATDPEAKSCIAGPFFLKWLAIPATEQYTQKAPDKIVAYRYLSICAYNAEDKDKMKMYMDELEKLDANDPVLKQLKDALEKAAKTPKPKAPAKK